MSETNQANTSPLAAEPEAIEAAKARTLKLSVREGMAWSLMWGFGECYVAPFALFLSAGNTAMALLSTLPSILGALAQIAGASLTERLGRRRPIMVACTAFHSLCYLPLFVLPLLFPSLAVPLVVVIFTLMITVNNISAPAWNSLMGDIIPEETRGRYMASRVQYMNLAMLLAMIAAAAGLSGFEAHGRTWIGYGCFFLLAMVARGSSAVLLSRHYDPPYHARPDAYFSFLDFIRRLPQSNFARFTLTVALMNGSTMVAAPFFIVYMFRDLHWTYLQWMVSTALFMATQILVYPWWGAICDRHGGRVVMRATSLMIPLIPLPWVFVTNYWILLSLQVLSGLAWSGFTLASTNFIFDAVTPEKRARVTSYYSVVNGVFCVLGGSVIGATLADHLPAAYRLGPFHVTFLSSLPAVFLISCLLRAGVTILLMAMFKEVRKTEPISSRVLLWRITSGEPILEPLGQLFDWVAAPLLRRNGNGE